ncbi:MAG: C40 family peptidase, partial [Oscillospiraceae bacterium]|nr:C40 family peptidase [Oscillospiraceae bacterium]
ATTVGVGTVNVEALRLREESNTNSKTLTTVYHEERVVVLEKVNEEWYKVSYKDTVGYMFGAYLDISAEMEANLGYGKVYDVDTSLNVRADAGTESRKVGSLDRDAVVKITGVKNGWYHVASGNLTGYVSSDYLALCKAPESKSENTQNAVPVQTNDVVGNAKVDEIIAYAKEFLGVPYVYGANGPDSFDCSGFTKYVYAHFGYQLNRSASGQLDNGREVSLSDIQPGDLVFFIYDGATTRASHVGMYIGNDQFIHASTGTKREVVISQLLGGSYQRTIVGVRRII